MLPSHQSMVNSSFNSIPLDHTSAVVQTRLSSNNSTQVCAVQTIGSSVRRVHPLVLPKLTPFSVTPEAFGRLQQSCTSLESFHRKASSGDVETARNGSSHQFLYKDNLLYRKCLTSNRPHMVGSMSLVVPSDCRPTVLQVAHEGPLSGHSPTEKHK